MKLPIIILFLLILIFIISCAKKQDNPCSLIAYEKYDESTYLEFSHFLLKDMLKEAEQFFPNFNISIDGEGKDITISPKITSCLYEGKAKSGNIVLPFYIEKNIDVIKIQEWKNRIKEKNIRNESYERQEYYGSTSTLVEVINNTESQEGEIVLTVQDVGKAYQETGEKLKKK